MGYLILVWVSALVYSGNIKVTFSLSLLWLFKA